MTLYARAITLRNCGRFSVVASDFGADYRTHVHVTSQALYASLTHGLTWRAGDIVNGQMRYPFIQVKKDHYDFNVDYDVAMLPIWFTPGLFREPDGHRVRDDFLDANYFNVVQEFFPSTSKKYHFKKGKVAEGKRPNHVPTYGTWQSILPDQRLHTFALGKDANLLTTFAVGQTFLMGKKRTMMQIFSLSEIVGGQQKSGPCLTGLLQLPPDGIRHFSSFNVMTATMRYLILNGKTRSKDPYLEFTWPGENVLNLPEFYLKQTPLSLV